MKEILSAIDAWLATASEWRSPGSSDRESGRANPSGDGRQRGRRSGRVGSGGCVEGAVVTEALECGEWRGRRCTFGYSDDQAFAVGLTCGGTVHLLVSTRLVSGEIYRELRGSILSRTPVGLVSVTASPTRWRFDALAAKLLVRSQVATLGTLGDPNWNRVVAVTPWHARARGLGNPPLRPHGEARREDIEVFVESFVSPPKLIVFGPLISRGRSSRSPGCSASW